MALTETKETRIEISGNGTVFVDTITKVLREGVEIASGSNRTSYHPGANVDALPENVQAICRATWTPEVVTAFKEAQAAVM